MEINDITGIIIEESINIHKSIGPGLLESVYEEILCYRLVKRALFVERQKPIPDFFEEVRMDIGFRADLIVEQSVVVEIKSIETIAPVHPKVLLTYLRLSDKRVGLIINFNEVVLKNGIKRVICTQ